MSAKTVKTTPVERDADLGPAGLRFAGSWPLGRLQAFANVRGDAEPSVNEELEFTAERLRQEVAARKRAEQRQRERELDLQQHIAELKDARDRLEKQSADLVRLAEDLSIARDQAEAANRAKSQFLANMNHELRTPLNAIIGFADVLKQETLGPVGGLRYRGYIENIHASGKTLLNLINDILSFSKIETGAETLCEERLDASEAIRSVVNLMGGRAEQAGIVLSQEIQGDLPHLQADEGKLKQILFNLLSNAIKFTGPDGKITLRVWCRAKSGFVFQIEDTGIGIAPEDIPKALSQFSQVDADLNRKHDGTGLGLPLSKSLTELHGGVFDLQSEPGVGTTATVRFPAARIVQPADSRS